MPPGLRLLLMFCGQLLFVFVFCGGDSVRVFVFLHILAFASFVLLVSQVLRYSGRAMASWPLSVVLAVHLRLRVAE